MGIQLVVVTDATPSPSLVTSLPITVHTITHSNAQQNTENIAIGFVPDVLIVHFGSRGKTVQYCTQARNLYGGRCFICVFHHKATEDAVFREQCFSPSTCPPCNMVTSNCDHLFEALVQICQCKDTCFAFTGVDTSAKNNTKLSVGRVAATTETKTFSCPICFEENLSEDGLWQHVPLYHVNHRNFPVVCPVCNQSGRASFPVHLRNSHGPCKRGLIEWETPTGIYSIGVCRRKSDGKFLMVQEFAGSGFWVLGGQVEKGETLVEGLRREALEEAGVDVRVLGILEILCDGTRWRRVTFLCEPVDEATCQPKTLPDYESTGAVWVDAELVAEHQNNPPKITLRNKPETRWFGKLHAGEDVVKPIEIPPEFQQAMKGIRLM